LNRTTISKKIQKIEKNVAAKAIIPPPKVFFFMQGREVESEAEGREINKLYLQWIKRVEKAIKSNSITLKQLLDTLPEPWKSAFIETLVKQIDEEKHLNKTDSRTTP
jgi:hypothetical protein